jgi:iron(III) transport system substrate-binding protein
MKKNSAAVALLGRRRRRVAQGQVNVICSVQAEWCNMMSTVYARTTGTRINMA